MRVVTCPFASTRVPRFDSVNSPLRCSVFGSIVSMLLGGSAGLSGSRQTTRLRLMIHPNALLVWLLTGLFGTSYYLIPEEAERDREPRTGIHPVRPLHVRRSHGGGRLPVRHPRGPRI